jgi:hypothetical protein
MRIVKGKIENGCGHFEKRMKNNSHAFNETTRETLFPGTLNIREVTNSDVKITEDFRIRSEDIDDSGIDESDQDFIFEICRVKGKWAYRVRPCNRETHKGGHGDCVLEIACSTRIRDLPHCNEGEEIEVELFNYSEIQSEFFNK